MKVLMINSHFTSGGPPRIINGIYDILIENGHECKIAAARGSEYAPADSVIIGKARDIYVNALRSRFFDNEGFNARKNTIKLIDDIKEYNPDIIHLHNLHGYYLNVEVLFDFLKVYKKPVVWTLHDMWPFSGHSAVCDYFSCEKWRTECSKCPCLKEYPKALFDFSNRNYYRKKNTFCNVDNLTIVTPSKWLARLVKDSFLGAYHVKVIHNGVDLSNFYPTNNTFKIKHGLMDKIVISAVAAVWTERKGLSDYFNLSKILSDKYAIVMVGLSKTQIKNLPNNIVGIEKTESIDELRDIYSASNVFVNFTYADTFGLVNLEALSCGTPVITYDTGGSPECIDANTGVVIKKGQYAEILEHLQSFEPKNDVQVKKCVERAQLFDTRIKYHEYLELFATLVDEAK